MSFPSGRLPHAANRITFITLVVAIGLLKIDSARSHTSRTGAGEVMAIREGLLKEVDSSGSLPIDRSREEQPGSLAAVVSVHADPVVGPRFSAFLERVNAVTEDKRPAVVDSFMAAVSSFPFVEEDTIVYYLYRGNANRVNVPGDANEWNFSALPMTRITGTNLWYAQAIFESDARLDYSFALNGITPITDPLNPHRVGYFGFIFSELAMPDYVQPPEIKRYPNIPHGASRNMRVSSAILGNSRTIRVYSGKNGTKAIAWAVGPPILTMLWSISSRPPW